MPFEKGHNQSTGRPKGSNNKVSKEIREVSAMLLQGQLEALQDKLPTLEDSDYIKAIGLLMKHVLPAQRQVEVETVFKRRVKSLNLSKSCKNKFDNKQRNT